MVVLFILPLKVFALGPCTGDKCEQGIPGMSVNGIDGDGLTPEGSVESSNVVGYGGEHRVTLNFFGEVDKNTGPLRKVAIDWNDDSTPYQSSGRFKNHLGRYWYDPDGPSGRGDSQCDDSDFSQSKDRACYDGYFSFTHTYSCPVGGAGKRSCAGSVETWNNCYARDSCPVDVNAANPGNGSCCVFKPRVQLKDNWGWCNGTCPGGPGGDWPGCYDTECRGIYSNENPWTVLAGRVIVVPK